MVMTGDLFKASVNESAAQEFRYDEAYNLDEELVIYTD